MIKRVTARIVSGTSAATIRKTIPAATTLGPDSQTIRRTGGKFLKAFRRSSHPLQQVRGLPRSFCIEATTYFFSEYPGRDRTRVRGKAMHFAAPCVVQGPPCLYVS